MLENFNVDKFFSVLRKGFGPMTQNLVNNINDLLVHVKQDTLITNNRQMAYLLATVKHETAVNNDSDSFIDTYQPIVELRNDFKDVINKRGQLIKSAESLYGYKTRLGKQLGNIYPGDGAAFKGAGLGQITGRGNAIKLENKYGWNLTNPPSNFRIEMTKLDKAYQALSYGMTVGLYTGKKLSDYINDSKCDYRNARRIINGDVAKNGARIAGYAKVFEKALEV